MKSFYEGIRQDDDLYKAVMMDLEQKANRINQEGFRRLMKKLTEIKGNLLKRLMV